MFKCPKCGSKDFWLYTKVWISDELHIDEEGKAHITFGEPPDLSGWGIHDVDEVVCAECETKIRREELEKLENVEYGDC